MTDISRPRPAASPVGAILRGLRHVFGANPIEHTVLPSTLLAAALSVIPTALLLFNNGHAIAQTRPFYVAMAATAGIAAGLVIVLSQKIAPHVAGGLVGALGYGFYSLSWVPGSNQLPSLTFFWLLTSLPAAVVVVWLLSNSRAVIVLAGVASGALATYLVVSPLTAAETPTATPEPMPPASLAFGDELIRSPNIYVFVLDGFSNPSVTTEQFAPYGLDFSIDSSIADLEQLGLRHDAQATSNYGQTILSVPSMLNATYPHTPEDPLTTNEVWSTGTPALRGNNVLVNTLQRAGYEYWSASSGAWDPSRCDPTIADRCLGTDSGNAEAMKAVWWYTPLRWQLGVTDFRKLPEPQTVVDDILDARATRQSEAPYVMISHIIGPHQPYRYEADCSFRDSNAPGTTLEEGHFPEFRPLYAAQATCMSEILVDAIDELLDADPDAMVFIQADHGSEFEGDDGAGSSSAWTPEMGSERLGIFRMTKVPDDCRSTDPRAQSVINTVPVILACVQGTEPDLIDPRHFFTDKSGETADIAEASLVFSSN